MNTPKKARSYRFISPDGEAITTESIKEFSETYGVNYQSAKELACGKRTRNMGWCSTHSKAKRQRQRFTTRLFNTVTAESTVLGRSIRHFAATHGLSEHDLGQLINGHIICYRGWVLEKTWCLVGGVLPNDIFTEWGRNTRSSELPCNNSSIPV